ncbi:MAG: YfhO family protein [Bacteroidia bacterium]|nr:YfhO family protein [Bacteroidia bacterium]
MKQESQSTAPQFDFKKLIPYLVALGAMLVILMIYFKPVLEGKELFQHDIYQSEGMHREVSEWREKTGKEALWTNVQFSGMPTYQMGAKYPGNLMKPVQLILRLGLPHPIGFLFWMFIGFFILMMVMQKNPWIAAMGAFGYTFSTYFFIALDAGHNTKIWALAMIPPLIGGILLVFKGRYLLGGALTALFTALQITSNHLQITYYFLFVLGAIGVVYAVQMIKDKKLVELGKSVAVLALAGLLGVGPNVSRLWTTYEYGKETIRGKSELTPPATASEAEKKSNGLDIEYAFRWSYGVGETFTIVVPNLYGGQSQQPIGKDSETYELVKKKYGQQAANQIKDKYPTYWGDQPFTSGPVYIGALIFFLFVLGLFFLDAKTIWWAVPVTVLTIMFSWGRNFPALSELFFYHFPLFNKFRAPAMWLVVAEFTLPLLAFVGLAKFLEKAKNDQGRDDLRVKFLIATGIAGGMLLLLWIAAPIMFDFTSGNMDLDNLGRMYGLKRTDPQLQDLMNALQDDRLSMLRADALRSLVIILIAAAALYLFILEKIKVNVVLPVLALLLVFDLWSVNARFLNEEAFIKKRDRMAQDQPTQVDQQILADPDPYFRVLNLTTNTFNDARTSYFHNHIGGYHPAKLRRYQDMIERHLSGQINPAVLDMLNTKYVIQKRGDKVAPARNPGAMGNAWFVENIQWVKNPDEEIAALTGLKVGETAVIDESKMKDKVGNFVPSLDSTATIKLTSYAPDELVYESSTSKDQLAVFSDIYYNDNKGWNAYVDGNKVSHFRVNWVLRGMIVPKGQHKIEFRFEPTSYYTGESISLASSIILLILVLGSLGFTIYKEVKGEGSSEEEEA